MKEQEQKLKQAIEVLSERARTTNVKQDARLGVDQADEDLPMELRRRQERLARLRRPRPVSSAPSQSRSGGGRHGMMNSAGTMEPGGLLNSSSASPMTKPRTTSPIPSRVL